MICICCQRTSYHMFQIFLDLILTSHNNQNYRPLPVCYRDEDSNILNVPCFDALIIYRKIPIVTERHQHDLPWSSLTSTSISCQLFFHRIKRSLKKVGFRIGCSLMGGSMHRKTISDSNFVDPYVPQEVKTMV